MFDDVLKDFLGYCQHEKNLAPRTIRAYRYWNEVFGRWADADNTSSDFNLRFTTPVQRRWLYQLSKDGKRPRTIHNAACSLRALGDFAVEHGIISANPARALVLPKKDAASRPVVSDQEAAALLAATEKQTSGKLVARDRALISTLIFCGVRRQELLDIRCQDVSPDCKTVLIASGKGRKSRTVYPNESCRTALAEWVRERKKIQTQHDYLWAYDCKRRLGDNGLRHLIEETAARAGFVGQDNIKPHAMRRGYATRLLAQGCDLRSLSASLGHSSPSVTLIYTFDKERPAEAMRDHADLNISDSRNTDKGLSPSPKPTRAETISRMRRRTTGGSK